MSARSCSFPTTAPTSSPTRSAGGHACWSARATTSRSGQQLIVGAVDPKTVLRILGPRKVQEYLTAQVQEVYRSQGVQIHDKHIEVIVRQMLRRVTIIESGRLEHAAR